MARFKKGNESEPLADPNARLVTTPEDRTKAGKWFARARDLGDKRQFDYAIEYYVNGLEFWPDAVEEGCRPLHGCAVARRQTGGKKPGLKDTMRRSMTDRNLKKAFLNALWLFGHEPDNLNYIDGVMKSASKMRAEDVACWAGGVYAKALETVPKASNKQFTQLAQVAEELGDRASERDETEFGIEAYQMGVDALETWRRRSPDERTILDAIRHLSTKLTILKGKYKDGGTYRDSMADAEEQRDLHDEERSIQSADRLEELIAKAQTEYEQNPNEDRPLKNIVDLLCRHEQETEELRAIQLLVDRFKSTQAYRWKQMADDIRMKQLGRQARKLGRQGDADAVKQHQINQLRFELAVYKERVERYPTDYRLKFEFGVRSFRAGRFDEAIPLLQTSRVDPKNRTACGLYLGRCFFRKEYHTQAVSTLQEALEEYEMSDDELARSMLYWLGRAHEGAGQADDARETYGKILRVDYNYRDVRARLDTLPG